MRHLLLVAALSCSIVTADPACDKVISQCQILVDEQDSYITTLKVQLKEVATQVEEKPLLPGWAWFIIGSAVGVAAGVTTFEMMKR